MPNEKLELCPFCGNNPIIEIWSSGGIMYIVKCNNPDCAIPADEYPRGHNLDEVISDWNNKVNKDWADIAEVVKAIYNKIESVHNEGNF